MEQFRGDVVKFDWFQFFYFFIENGIDQIKFVFWSGAARIEIQQQGDCCGCRSSGHGLCIQHSDASEYIQHAINQHVPYSATILDIFRMCQAIWHWLMLPPINWWAKWWTCNTVPHLLKMPKCKRALVRISSCRAHLYSVSNQIIQHLRSFKNRFFGYGRFAFVHHHGWCTSTPRWKSFGSGATQHRYLQRNHSEIGPAQSRYNSVDCIESGRHSHLCCMETERFAEESCHWVWYQFGFVAFPFLDVATSGHCTNIMPWMDYWGTWWLKRWVHASSMKFDRKFTIFLFSQFRYGRVLTWPAFVCVNWIRMLEPIKTKRIGRHCIVKSSIAHTKWSNSKVTLRGPSAWALRRWLQPYWETPTMCTQSPPLSR